VAPSDPGVMTARQMFGAEDGLLDERVDIRVSAHNTIGRQVIRGRKCENASVTDGEDVGEVTRAAPISEPGSPEIAGRDLASREVGVPAQDSWSGAIIAIVGDGRRGLIAALLVEVISIPLLGWLLLLRVQADIPLQVLGVGTGGYTKPGFSVVSSIDWTHLGLLLATGAGVVVALLVAIVTAMRMQDLGVPSHERQRLSSIRVATVVCGVLAIAFPFTAFFSLRGWSPHPPLDIGSPDRWQTGVVLTVAWIAAVATLALGLRVLQLFACKIRVIDRILTLTVGVLLVAGIIGSQYVRVSDSYSYIRAIASNGAKAIPIVSSAAYQGYRIVAFHQVPSTQFLTTASCGADDICMAFGIGAWHRVGGQYPEVAVSIDGGATWRAWIYPSLLGVTPRGGAACFDRTCIVSEDGSNNGSYLKATVDDQGSVLLDLVGSVGSLSPLACPTSTWCATPSFDKGGADLLVSTNGGQSWVASPVPLPHGTSLTVGPLIACPSVNHCIIPLFTPLSDPQAVKELEDNRPITNPPPAGFTVTFDGGSSWAFSSVAGSPGLVRSVSCATDSSCWALAGSFGDPATTAVLVSSDGGTSWNTLADPDPWGDHPLQVATCWGTGQCTVMTQPLGSESRGTDYTTLDGGGTWATTSAPQLTSIHCQPTGRCIGFASGAPSLYLKDSPDGPWQSVRLGVPRPAEGPAA